MMRLPADHPQRVELNDEVHARPPEALATPVRVSYLALLSPSSERDAEWRKVRDLAARYDVASPDHAPNHYSADFGPFRLKWERHNEFARYTFIAPGLGDAPPFSKPAIAAVSPEWLADLPGKTIVAAHVVLAAGADARSAQDVSADFFDGNILVGSSLAEHAAVAFTDFRIHEDGFSRFLVQDRGLASWQAGRLVQRLLEIDTYRVMALLALPVAREASSFLTQREPELAQITQALAQAADKDEPHLLDRLTQLAADIESRVSGNRYRFSAADAYYELVQRRISELREERIPGLQTYREFIERRLAPAMNTCRSVSARQEDLSDRVARATQLLSTRVDITRERQNQDLLSSMNRRAALQLRLQSTVEGLSVAAVTYYVVGLVGYAAKALAAGGVPVSPDMAIGVAIPVVALAMSLALFKIKRSVSKHDS